LRCIDFVGKSLSRDGSRWYFDQFSEPTDVIDLSLFDARLSLADIYEDIPLV
jgi:hypothetical protein